MKNRRTLHALVDELPESELPAAQRFLEYLRRQPEESLRSMLAAAPLDDEPLTEEDLAAIREGLEEKARGDVVTHEEVRRLLRGTR